MDQVVLLKGGDKKEGEKKSSIDNKPPHHRRQAPQQQEEDVEALSITQQKGILAARGVICVAWSAQAPLTFSRVFPKCFGSKIGSKWVFGSKEKRTLFLARFWDFQTTYRLFLSQATRTDNTSFVPLICFFFLKGMALHALAQVCSWLDKVIGLAYHTLQQLT